MRLLYAPSARRMIPYPPVATALLAAAVPHCAPKQVDLEMRVRDLHGRTQSCLLYEGGLELPDVLAPALRPEVDVYRQQLLELAEIEPGEVVGISVMGRAQLASAMLLARAALAEGCRVILGGQFWTAASAERAVCEVLRPHDITITV